MTKIVVALCEGQHDIAFLSRILSAYGYKSYDKKIKNMLEPFNKQFATELKNKEIGDKKLGFQSNHRIPSVSYEKDDKLIFLHNMGGDSREIERREVIDMYSNLRGDDDFTSQYELEFLFAVFLDADELGVEERFKQLRKEFQLDSLDSQASIKGYGKSFLAAYVFHGEGNKGTLEDVLIKLMKNDHSNLLNEAELFVMKNEVEKERTKAYICTDETEDYTGKSMFCPKKSTISISGQVQFSGVSNNVFIAKTDLLNKKVIENDNHCRSIADLFDSF